MRDTIETILRKYKTFRETTPFKGAHEINQLFASLRAEVERLPAVKSNPNLIVKSSYGKGSWAAVPWLAILDIRETSSTQNGTYVVILFAEDGSHCDIKLAQGVTEVKAIFKKNATDELKRRADKVRQELVSAELQDFLPAKRSLRLGDGNLARFYASSTIFSQVYSVDSIPTDEHLAKVIATLVSAYDRYISNRISESYEESPDDRISVRVWALPAGEGGNRWNEFLEKGQIAIGWDQLTDLNQYSSQEQILEVLKDTLGGNPFNDALCCYQFSHEMTVGDIIVAKAGRKRICGMGKIVSEYYWNEAEPDFKHRRKVEWLRTEPTEFPGKGTAVKTLTEITGFPTFMELVNDYLGFDTDVVSVDTDSEPDYDKFSVQTIIDQGSFLSEDQLNSVLARLQIKKNVILQGPPGTGKTWLARRLGYALIGQKNPDRIKVVQFHSSITYEDFVRGYRPTSEGKLALVDGAFMEAISDARNSTQPLVVVIEEVNRGNPAQIFGEMLTLLEADKRSPRDAIALTYKARSGERVHIPPNLYVIGTMNIADRSLALVDLALRRRFAFIDLEPNLNGSWRDWLVNRCGFSRELVAQIEGRMTQLNETISKDQRLGSQFRVGHSYVTPPEDANITDPERWFKAVVDTEISPLLQEYWFDDHETANRIIRELKRGL